MTTKFACTISGPRVAHIFLFLCLSKVRFLIGSFLLSQGGAYYCGAAIFSVYFYYCISGGWMDTLAHSRTVAVAQAR